MNLRPFGTVRVLRGLREGRQGTLLLGLALIAIQKMRDSRGKRELIYRKKLPVGSTVVIRHDHPGEPKVQVRSRPYS